MLPYRVVLGDVVVHGTEFINFDHTLRTVVADACHTLTCALMLLNTDHHGQVNVPVHKKRRVALSVCFDIPLRN